MVWVNEKQKDRPYRSQIVIYFVSIAKRHFLALRRNINTASPWKHNKIREQGLPNFLCSRTLMQKKKTLVTLHESCEKLFSNIFTENIIVNLKVWRTPETSRVPQVGNRCIKEFRFFWETFGKHVVTRHDKAINKISRFPNNQQLKPN